MIVSATLAYTFACIRLGQMPRKCRRASCQLARRRRRATAWSLALVLSLVVFAESDAPGSREFLYASDEGTDIVSSTITCEIFSGSRSFNGQDAHSTSYATTATP